MKTAFKKMLISILFMFIIVFSVNNINVNAAHGDKTTVSFAIVNLRTSYSTSKQTWANNGLTIVNNKGNAPSAIPNRYNPVLFVAGSEVIIQFTTTFSSVSIYCYSSSYAKKVVDIVDTNIATATSSNSTAVITLKEPSASLTLTLKNDDLLVRTITVIEYNEAESIILDKIDALNSVSGYMSLGYKYTRERVTETNFFSDVDFRLRCGVDKKLSNIEGVSSYGIRISSSAKSKLYDATSEYWNEDDSCYYVIISLGDVLTNSSRIYEEFTVDAYIVVDGATYYSKSYKKYSIYSIVDEYYNNEETKSLVTSLYDLLVEMDIYAD